MAVQQQLCNSWKRGQQVTDYNISLLANIVTIVVLNLLLYGKLVLRASLCKILISSFSHKMDFAHNFSVDFF